MYAAFVVAAAGQAEYWFPELVQFPVCLGKRIKYTRQPERSGRFYLKKLWVKLSDRAYPFFTFSMMLQTDLRCTKNQAG
jgi:hypothetical protein